MTVRDDETKGTCEFLRHELREVNEKERGGDPDKEFRGKLHTNN
jgi:hypothetical protein